MLKMDKQRSIYFQLMVYLALRDIKIRYKQAVFGIAWAVVNPLFQALAISFIFSHYLGQPGKSSYYFLFVYTGFIFWNFFVQSLNASVYTLVGNADLVTKAVFPKEILVYSTLLSKVPDLIIPMILLLFLLPFYHIPFTIAMLWLPYFLVVQFLFTLSLCLLFAWLNVYFRDITALIPLVTMVWLFLTPIAYSMDSMPQIYRSISFFNPMTGIVEGVRAVLLGEGNFASNNFFVLPTLVIALFFFNFILFKKAEKGFADTI